MITHFKSALENIKAEEELVRETEAYLKDALNNKINKKRWGLHTMNMKRIAMAACMAMVLISGTTEAYAYYQTPVKYLSLDINPSVELGVNALDKVVTAEGYNNDGKLILNGTNVIGSDLDDAVSTLVSSAADNGFVAEDGSTVISLTSETDDAKVAAEIEAQAQDGASAALDETGSEAVIEKDNVALERRDEARALQITPGKLNLIEKLMAVDPTATVDQYKTATVKDIMYKTKAAKGKGNVVNKEPQVDSSAPEESTSVQNSTKAASTEASAVNEAAASTGHASSAVVNESVLDNAKNSGNKNSDSTLKEKSNGNPSSGNSGKSKDNGKGHK